MLLSYHQAKIEAIPIPCSLLVFVLKSLRPERLTGGHLCSGRLLGRKRKGAGGRVIY
jgi:hypothetical protein